MWTEVTMMKLSCDEPGCDAVVSDEETGYDGYFAAQQHAVDAAIDQDWDMEYGQPPRCPQHARPQCLVCDSRHSTVAPGAGGELICAECAAACRQCGMTGWHKLSCSVRDPRNAPWLAMAAQVARAEKP